MKSILLVVLIGLLTFLYSNSYSQTPDWGWARSAGGVENDYAFHVAVDASGNAYITGIFGSPTITFGSYILTNTGGATIFFVKYDANGNVSWAKSAAITTGYAEGFSIAVDASGNAYLTGVFSGSNIIFGSDTLTNEGKEDIFLVKYDASGNVLWAKNAGGTGDDRGYSVAVDTSGNAYVTGYFLSSAIIFGSDTLTNAGWANIFLVKYDASGNVQWAKSAGEIDDLGISVACDVEGNAYMMGLFSSQTITFGSITLANAGDMDIFLAKYDAGGTVLWAKSAGGTDYDRGYSAALDTSGNAYVTGNFYSSTIIFSSDTLTGTGDGDVFLVKFNSDGNVLWAKSASGSTAGAAGFSVAVDNSGNAYITGYFTSPAITFGSYTLTNGNIFLVKYDIYGNVLWAKSGGGTEVDVGSSVAVDASENIYLTGDFTSHIITFGYDTLTNAHTYTSDVYLVKSGSSSVGNNESYNSINLMIYPNPVTDKLMLVVPQENTKRNISIINLDGRELLHRDVKEVNTTIDVSTLSSGIYFLKVMGEKTILIGKFIKK